MFQNRATIIHLGVARDPPSSSMRTSVALIGLLRVTSLSRTLWAALLGLSALSPASLFQSCKSLIIVVKLSCRAGELKTRRMASRLFGVLHLIGQMSFRGSLCSRQRSNLNWRRQVKSRSDYGRGLCARRAPCRAKRASAASNRFEGAHPGRPNSTDSDNSGATARLNERQAF